LTDRLEHHHTRWRRRQALHGRGQSRSVSVDHYENFPVASLLCPPALRPAVTAIYRFARTADDIADEGDAPASERQALLRRYRQALDDAAAGRDNHGAWASVFAPLAQQIARHRLPLPLLRDLLSAFEQDTHNAPHADRASLLDYSSRSANPIGRLLLHLADVRGANALAQSDAVCSALQLINFWQDLSVDLPRGRCYLPLADARRHGVDVEALLRDSAASRRSMRDSAASRRSMRGSAASLRSMRDSEASRRLIHELCSWARSLMNDGAPLVHRLPGRFGWELRLVVQGGLRVLDKIEAHGFNALTQRPTVGKADMPLLLWRALRMTRGSGAAVLRDRAAR
jgi:hydroxysqualene synthase